MYVCMCVELLSASIREFNLKDKICFEVSAAAAGKKGMKKYVFAFEREGEKVLAYIHTYIHIHSTRKYIYYLIAATLSIHLLIIEPVPQ